MRFSLRVPASGDARFASSAFDASIGKTVHVGLPGDHGIVVAADVADDGRTAVLTVECGGEARRRFKALAEESWRGDYSFGFTPREGITMTPVPAVPTPADPGWLTSALRDLYEEYRSIEPWKGGRPWMT